MRNKIPADKEKTRLASMRELRTITLTITATEATLQRLSSLLLFAEIPFTAEQRAAEKEKNGLGSMPWEDPKDARYVPPPPTTEELVEQATKLITGIANSFVGGREQLQQTLASFGVARLSEIPAEKLPLFIDALKHMPGAEENDPDVLI